MTGDLTVGLGEDDIGAALAPMGTGATGYVFPVLAPLCHGGTSVILDRWSDPAVAVDLIASQRCTFATAIPTQMALMVPALEQRQKTDFDDFRCFNNAGAPLMAEIGHKIESLMSCRVQSVYGSTDGGVPCMTSIEDPAERRIGTVGRVLPGRSFELRAPDGKTVGAGEIGEVCWRSPDKSFGYLNDLDASKVVFDEPGFYRSGDLGHLEQDGYLRIVGRAKDMVLRGGRNISPRMIEEHLIAHPAVREVAVAAMPHTVLGEQACAFVVLREGQSLDLGVAVEFLKARKLSVWQLPERLEVMSELPCSAGGKVMKNKLTEWIAAKLLQVSAGDR